MVMGHFMVASSQESILRRDGEDADGISIRKMQWIEPIFVIYDFMRSSNTSKKGKERFSDATPTL